MIKKQLPFIPTVGYFYLTPSLDGVKVELECAAGVATLMEPINVAWDDIEDMNIICDKFRDLQMKAFKPLAEALGTMYANRALYEALIE